MNTSPIWKWLVMKGTLMNGKYQNDRNEQKRKRGVE